MFKLAIEVCFENHFGLIHAIFLSLGSTKSGYFFLGHPVYKYIEGEGEVAVFSAKRWDRRSS